ncbi:MAG: hypothetical protein R3268_00745 [Acidiferrobacterales bacterium]|nr:hypothetical protein [Acidiferrobacterales bacterium]
MDFRLVAAGGCVLLATFTTSHANELGEEVFRARCMACHAISCNKIGPKLEGVIGRKVGSLPDFDGYSAEMQSAGFVWSKEKLDVFLADPAATIPGTLMVSAGKLENPTDRQNLIGFLEKGDTSLDLCF